MKKYILCCFAVLLYISSLAQQDNTVNKDSLDIIRQKGIAIRLNQIQNAEFIFEGVVKKIDHYMRPNKDGNDFNTNSIIILITKVFRGNLNPGTVEIVRMADPRFESSAVRGSMALQHQDTTPAIYFCRASNIYPYDPKYNIDIVDNKTILSLNTGYTLKYTPYALVELGVRKEISKGDYYRFLGSFPNITMPVLTKADTAEIIIPSNHIAVPSTARNLTEAEIDSLREVSAQKLYEEKKKSENLPTLKNDVIDTISKSPQFDSINQNSRLKANWDEVNLYKIIDYIDGTPDSKPISNYDNIYLQSDLGSYLIYNIQYYIARDDYTNVSISISSENEKIVSTYKSPSYTRNYGEEIAVIQAEGYGTTYIYLQVTYYYILGGKSVKGWTSKMYRVVVPRPPIESLSLDEHNLELTKYSQQVLTPIILPEEAVNEVTWTSSNPKVASVNNTGVVTAISSGTASIIATSVTDKTKSDQCAVTVIEETGISVLPKHIEIENNAKPVLEVQVIPSGRKIDNSNLKWSTSDSKVATVFNGVVTPISAGTAYICATTIDGLWDDCSEVTINPYISSITYSSVGDVFAGVSEKITIKGYGFGSTKGSGYITFTSADGNIENALVDDFDKVDYLNDVDKCKDCSWKDNEITMFLPGNILGSDKIVYSIGSGNILVTNNKGKSNMLYQTDNKNFFKIDHDIMSIFTKDGLNKYNMKLNDKLYGLNGNIPFIVNFPTSFDANKQKTISNIINWAMAVWNCNLGINFEIDNNAINPNIIKFESIKNINDPTKSALGLTTWPGVIPINENKPYDAYRSVPAIISINSDINNWAYELPKPDILYGYDFYNTIMHELGHVLGLDHVNYSDLMFFSQPDIGLTRSDITTKAINGAKKVINESEDFSLGWFHPTLPSPNCPMLPVTTGFNSSIINSNSILFTWKTVPNDQSVTITIARDDVPIFTTDGTSSSFTDKGITVGNIYKYSLISSNKYGSITSELIVSTKLPSNNSTASGQTISWTAIPGATYIVEKSTSPTFTNVTSSKVLLNNSFTDQISPGETVYYKVKTINASGGTSISQMIKVIGCFNYVSGILSVATIWGIYPNGSPYPSGYSNVFQGETIVTSGTPIVSSGANIVARATQIIHFKPGFSARQGSTVHALIMPVCGNSLKKYIIDSTVQASGAIIQSPTTLKSGIDSSTVSILSSKISIYPNPTQGVINVESMGESFSYELYNIVGILLKKELHCVSKTQVDLNGFSAGSYYLKVLSNDNKQEVFSVLKE